MKKKEIIRGIEKVRGFINPEEGEKLYELAKACPKNKAIVEIGAYYGKSSIYLGKGSKKGHEAKVYSVDWHKGDFEDEKDYGKLNTFPSFWKNIQKFGLDSVVIPIVLKSEEARKSFKRKIGLLFLDADHRYKAIKKDFEMWAPLLSKNGWVCIHDTRAREGPKKLYKEKIVGSKLFTDLEDVRNMSIARKK